MTTAGTTTAGPRERDELLARLDALERTHDKPHPLWKNTALVGLIGTLVAVIPPSLTAIREYYQTEREVRLSLAKYQHERTLSYLDRALSPETEEAKQAQVFRFLRHLPEEDPVRRWAEGELHIVEESIEALKEEIAANKVKLQQLELEKTATLDQATAALEIAAPKDDVETVVQAAQLEVGSYERKIEALQEKTTNLEIRAGQTPAARAGSERVETGLAGDAPQAVRPSQWRLQIATEPKLDEAQAKADKARKAGADPILYRKNGLYFVTVGRYGSMDEASQQAPQASRYLRKGARPVDIMVWCSSQRPQPAFIDCT